MQFHISSSLNGLPFQLFLLPSKLQTILAGLSIVPWGRRRLEAHLGRFVRLTHTHTSVARRVCIRIASYNNEARYRTRANQGRSGSSSYANLQKCQEGPRSVSVGNVIALYAVWLAPACKGTAETPHIILRPGPARDLLEKRKIYDSPGHVLEGLVICSHAS